MSQASRSLSVRSAGTLIGTLVPQPRDESHRRGWLAGRAGCVQPTRMIASNNIPQGDPLAVVRKRTTSTCGKGDLDSVYSSSGSSRFRASRLPVPTVPALAESRCGPDCRPRSGLCGGTKRIVPVARNGKKVPAGPHRGLADSCRDVIWLQSPRPTGRSPVWMTV